jgi:predicted branched-subunit amino acid permease
MKHHLSCLKGDTIKAIILVCLAVGVVGMSYGSLAMAYGFPVWVPFVLSITVLAGASEFMFIGIVASGGNPLAAAAAGLLVNARHVPFGVTVRELVGKRGLSLLGCHIMNDESVVFGLSQKTPEQRKAAYWLCGLAWRSSGRLARCWGRGGQTLTRPETIGLDAVFPAILLALVVPAFKNRTTLIRACSGAMLSLAAVPFAPVGLPVLLSLLGLAARKNNGKHDILYSGYRHLIGRDVSDASWRGETGNRLALSERSQALLSDAATVLLFSVALATTFYEGEHFAGMARVLGVAFAVFLAWRKMPLIVVIVAAAVVTALLRLAGIQ